MNPSTGSIGTPLPTLHDPIYTQRLRMRGWNRRVGATVGCQRTAAKVLKRLAPHWSREDHLRLAEHHARRAQRLQAIWSLVADRAAQDLLGRPFAVTDYRICAIGREDFAEHHKRVLRHCAYGSTQHRQLADAHACAARTARRARPLQEA